MQSPVGCRRRHGHSHGRMLRWRSSHDGSQCQPPAKPEAQLHFLRLATGIALSRDSMSFWAVRGKDREVSMCFRPDAGKSDSIRFLRFKVAAMSLVRRPDGSPFAFGDSIRITIRVRDMTRLIADFSPSGLVFNPADPADLRLDFTKFDEDYNHDGAVDNADCALVATFAIWKQESVGQPWVRLLSLVEVSDNLPEIEAQILSFTNHAIAY